MAFYVYLLASYKKGKLYSDTQTTTQPAYGTTRKDAAPPLRTRHKGTRLVWLEAHDTREAAKRRGYQIKSWNRAWKIELIEKTNPDWDDLYNRLNN